MFKGKINEMKLHQQYYQYFLPVHLTSKNIIYPNTINNFPLLLKYTSTAEDPKTNCCNKLLVLIQNFNKNLDPEPVKERGIFCYTAE